MAVVESAVRAFLLWFWAAVLRFIFLPPEPETISPPPPRTSFPFIELPESVREQIYLLLEYSREDYSGENRVVMVNSPDETSSHPKSISEWSSKNRRFNAAPYESARYGQGRFCNQLFYVSRAISQDARSFLYSHNKFRFHGMGSRGIPHLSALTKVALNSIRDIRVQLSTIVPRRDRIYPGVPFKVKRGNDWHFSETKQVIVDWKDTCLRLAHAPTSQLSLFLVSGTATLSSAKAILHPVLNVQLKECSIRFGAVRNNNLQRYVEYIVSRSTKKNRSEKSLSLFRFADLPMELQMKVLEHTDLVPSPEISSQGLQWDTSKKAFSQRDCMPRSWYPPHPFDMTCKARELAFSSSNRCWEFPKALLQTSKSKEQSRFICYQKNRFSIDIHVDHQGRRFSKVEDVTWHDLGFLGPLPQDCIRYLRYLHWKFTRGLTDEYFEPFSKDTIELVEAVRSLREQACIWKLTLVLCVRQHGYGTNIAAFRARNMPIKRMVETVGPELHELKDLFIHFRCWKLDPDQQWLMEQEFERVVKE
ncbi:uncharacterized protein N7473_003113 [Penicillium subrubescens]|uniref:F-box domain-containing protein n=1 Tax=Penicillium subrubescens TaxID=1316194 RepID=A0A1Q5TQ84_9EURO|nr:uncharacterized protein N7473_003113 [Penicillium subrubescens]KAJ5906197.1 hypothetical protein N7473_003113 [Penicillium subrubescens]OKP02362.1 hypothetical protein PENSUB_7126 [Penicillium subrubescens]